MLKDVVVIISPQVWTHCRAAQHPGKMLLNTGAARQATSLLDPS
jgi:hypothetical protein